MDIISDVLSRTIVKGRTTQILSLRGDWSFETPQSDEAVFYLVSKGAVFVSHDHQTTMLNEGDMVFFSNGHAHVLSSTPGAPTITLANDECQVQFHTIEDGRVIDFAKAGPATETLIVRGRFICERSAANHLLKHLPDCVTVRRENDDTNAWLVPLLRQIASETRNGAPGAQAALDSLLNMLFIQFLRGWLHALPSDQLGWLRGLEDVHVTTALALIHSEPTKPWTVQKLATRTGMSRSNFAARFAELVGEPPLRYLTRWRMILAAQILNVDLSRTVSSIAQEVGYDSEAAFSAAFKRQYGKPPGTWRRDGILSEGDCRKSA